MTSIYFKPHPAASVAFIGCLLLSSAAAAQTYPFKPIRTVVAQSTGGNADFIARIFAQGLSDRLSQQIVVDNRPGGAGIIAAEMVARASPDGYTLLLAPTGFGINPALYPKLPYDPQRDFAPVSLLAASSAVVVVNPALQVKSIGDLIAMAGLMAFPPTEARRERVLRDIRRDRAERSIRTRKHRYVA